MWHSGNADIEEGSDAEAKEKGKTRKVNQGIHTDRQQWGGRRAKRQRVTGYLKSFLEKTKTARLMTATV